MNCIEAGLVHGKLFLVICGQVFYVASELMNCPTALSPLGMSVSFIDQRDGVYTRSCSHYETLFTPYNRAKCIPAR